MPSFQILYENDHQMRAQALATSLVNDAIADDIDKTPEKVAGLKTLIFWGHGNQVALCNKSGRGIVEIINAWKKLNSDLKTVEIITCNSRHFDEKVKSTKPTKHIKSVLTHLGSEKRINNSIAKVVKRGLKYSLYPSIRKIRVLSMPESVRGSYKQHSILYWDPPSTSWCYVTGATEPEMFTTGTNIKYTKKMPPDPLSQWDDARTGDFPTRLAAAKIDFPSADYSDCVAGPLNTLRDVLVEIN